MKEIIVAGGCFWGVEEYFRRIIGVVDTAVGYAQGHQQNVTYQEVCTQRTNHAEVVWIKYDEAQLSLIQVCEFLFRIIDPTSLNKQGNDVGNQYRVGIYPSSQAEVEIVKQFLKEKQKAYQKPLVVEVELVHNFQKAEDYHQLYLENNPHGYCHVDMNTLLNHEVKERYRKA
ncbi:MAG: peptide-methionine (S)-S-oxide reductase MsrA [Erysipelothrix sp.]|nr:peptide-methionine (S)-S-oxide reductase MsrA [Erysipelothrix sp.]